MTAAAQPATNGDSDKEEGEVLPFQPFNPVALFFGMVTLVARVVEVGVDLSDDPELKRTFYLHCRNFPIITPICIVMALLALPAWIAKLRYAWRAIRERERLVLAIPSSFQVIGIPIMATLLPRTLRLVGPSREVPREEVLETLLRMRMCLIVVAVLALASEVIVFKVLTAGAHWGIKSGTDGSKVVRVAEPCMFELLTLFWMLVLCLADWGVAIRGDEAWRSSWMQHRVTMPGMHLAHSVIAAAACCKLAAVLIYNVPEFRIRAPGGFLQCVKAAVGLILVASFLATDTAARLPMTVAACKTALVLVMMVIWLLDLAVRNKGVTMLVRASSEEAAIAAAARAKEESAPGKRD